MSTSTTREPTPPWEDLELTEEELSGVQCFATDPRNYNDETPPQLVRTVNLLARPEHDLRGPEDLDGIAGAILTRTRQGLADVFAHEDYAGYEDERTEVFARAVAEHQTGIPFAAPALAYGSPKAVARRLVEEGLYPLVGQGRQAVTTALCIGGWDGGHDGEIGGGPDARAEVARLGRGWDDVPRDLNQWSDALWSDIPVGACLFWSGDEPGGGGHVAMVLRKHPDERRWQLWDTLTSLYDPAPHTAVGEGARVLWESPWLDTIPATVARKLRFRGIASIPGVGAVRPNLRPRGRARLLLRRRSDQKLLLRSAWLDMAAEGLPVSWLLRGLRGAPFYEQIEATFCVNSPAGEVADFPQGLPLVDCTVDAKGNARLGWKWQWKRGYHERESPEVWEPEAAYRDG